MTPRLRILMIGPINSPHMEDLALALQARGHTLQAGGAPWGGGLKPSRLPEAGIPVSLISRPQVLWLRRLMQSFRPDVVHANWMGFAAVGVVARARPLVAMPWGSDVYLATGWRRLLNKLVARRADLVVADSEALAGEMQLLGAAARRTEIINWGVDLGTFRPLASSEEKSALRSSLGLGGGPVVFSPRGLGPLYNPHVVAEAFGRVARAIPRAQFIVKHLDGEDALRDFRSELGDRVHTVGWVPYSRIADYYRAADVSVSITSSDSSPRSVWEAMASGCSCVISDLPWVHELIEPDVQALVVRPNATEVADAIKRILTQNQVRDSLAARARELVENHRDAAKEMDRLESLYLQLAGRPA
jgi:glycosyltransferase involved in cell wall biosynthesis